MLQDQEEEENVGGLESPDMPNKHDQDNSNIIPMAYGNDRSDTVRLLLDSTPVLKRIRADLLNKKIIITKKGEEVWEDTGYPPLITEEGCNNLLIQLSSFVNENTVSGIYSDEEIRIKTIWSADTCIEWLATNWKKYGVMPSNRPVIVLVVEQNVNAVLKKAKNGATLETIGEINKIHQIQTTTMQTAPPPKTKLIDRINPFGMIK